MSQLTERIQTRNLCHLIERSLTGTIVYPLLWGLLFFTTGLAQQYPLATTAFGLLILLLSSFRAVLVFMKQKRYIKPGQISLLHALFVLSILLTASLWSGFVVWLYLQGPTAKVEAIALIVIAGIASGGSSALAPRLDLVLAFLGFLLIPIALVQLVTAQNLDMMLMVLFYLMTMCMLAYSQNLYYKRALAGELELEEKNRTLSRLSQIDGLTQLANRTTFDSHLEAEWRRALREKRSISLLMLDLDHFKQLNDRYGHLAGDEALRRVSDLLKAHARRPGDLAARYGGEEFVLLLPGSNEQASLQLAEELRVAIEELHPVIDGQSLSLTVSIGVSCQVPSAGRSATHLLSCADRALYAAKGAGRNQVLLSPTALVA